jgi:tetratricopeptide (TPR) repeat protein
MEVKLTTQSVWFCSFALVLALGRLPLATAQEAIAADGEVSSTIFVTDDTGFVTDDSGLVTEATEFVTDDTASAAVQPGKASQRNSAQGSVVFIEDTPAAPTFTNQQTAAAPPAFVAPLRPAAQGDLKVITNRTTQVGLEALRGPQIQQPLLPLLQPPTVPATTIQQVATDQPIDTAQAAEPIAPVEREQPGDIEIAVHAEAVSTPPATRVSTLKPYEELLVLAHQLSLEAESIEDYTQIADACDEAIQYGAKADKRHFARQLSSWALNRRGQLHADGGEQELATADFQSALEFNPRNWRAMHNRGVSYAQQGKFAEAFDDFNMVVQLNPQYAKAYANRATLYVQAKDLHSAMNDYELAIQQDSSFATAYVGLGRVCHMLGRWDDAIEYFNSAVDLEPKSPDIVCSRGDLQADMGNYSAALTDYARTIDLDPEFAHAYRNGAWLLATCPDEAYRDSENALLGAQQALEYSYGDRHVALDTLAAAYASSGQFTEAIATLNQAVEIAPEDAKLAYQSRLELYQTEEPFRTEPIGEVTQVGFEE